MIRKSHQRIKITTEEDFIWFPNCPEARECGNFYRDAGFPSVLGCGLDPVLRQCTVSLLVSADTEGVLHIPYIPLNKNAKNIKIKFGVNCDFLFKTIENM